MCQIAVSVWEIWLEFQSSAVGSNGLRNVSRILNIKDEQNKLLKPIILLI